MLGFLCQILRSGPFQIRHYRFRIEHQAVCANGHNKFRYVQSSIQDFWFVVAGRSGATAAFQGILVFLN